MSVEPQVSSGDNQPSSGSEAGENPKDESPGKEESDAVSYRSYQKVLTEKKNLAERYKAQEAELERIKQEQVQAQEEELKKQNQYKELYEGAKKQLDEQSTKYDSLVEDVHKQKKVASFLSALKGQVDPEYHIFIDTDSIMTDPESGDIDEMSVTKEVERFMKKHPALVQRSHENATTSHYPKGEHSLDNKITRSEWLKLPPKEMAKWLKHTDRIID